MPSGPVSTPAEELALTMALTPVVSASARTASCLVLLAAAAAAALLCVRGFPSVFVDSWSEVGLAG